MNPINGGINFWFNLNIAANNPYSCNQRPNSGGVAPTPPVMGRVFVTQDLLAGFVTQDGSATFVTQDTN